MKHLRSKTYIELRLMGEEDGSGFNLAVESQSVKESEQLFGRLLKKIQKGNPGCRMVKAGVEGLYR